MVSAPIAVTMGEPAGIGPELLLKAWRDRDRLRLPPFVALADPDHLASLARALDWSVPLRPVDDCAAATGQFHLGLPVLAMPLAAPAVPGRPDPANGPTVIAMIERGVALTRSGEAAALATNPINKAVLAATGFPHPGHTEFLAELAGGVEVAMLLEGGGLRVVPVTIHLSLAQAAARLSSEGIVRAGRITARDLRHRFGLAAPRLAVAALNPHAGEGGLMGDEEIRVIAPAVSALRQEGIDTSGPYPADTLFHEAARSRYDAVLCMYHDQALIPLKTLDFWGGVNVTLGLPFIRVSPDHGTAFDIAGTGRAEVSSLAAALRLAARMASIGD